MRNLSHYADLLAIPFFILSSIYFYQIENKTPLEYMLFLFSVLGALADIFFTVEFFATK